MVDFARIEGGVRFARGQAALDRVEMPVADLVAQPGAQSRPGRAARRHRPAERRAQIVGCRALLERGFLARARQRGGAHARAPERQIVDRARIGLGRIVLEPSGQFLARGAIMAAEIAVGQHVAHQRAVAQIGHPLVGRGDRAARLELENLAIKGGIGGRQRLRQLGRAVHQRVESRQRRGLDPAVGRFAGSRLT
jgi:hypothetical protein